MWLLTNPTRDYPWGSPTAIPDLLNQPVTGAPVAEVWMGAHPAGSSTLSEALDTRTLHDAISQDPVGTLGTECAQEYANQLPFLVKLLAPNKALSIQVHPNTAQAQAGFAAENAAGIPRDAAHRNYRDDQPKPEILVALTDFAALCGLRPPELVHQEVAELSFSGQPELLRQLTATQHCGCWQETLAWALSDSCPVDITELAHAASGAATGSHSTSPLPYLATIANQYPNDPGVLIALCMHHYWLAPGEGLAISAGIVHAYRSGLGLEVLAASDNVVRAGLTGKHIDTTELLRLLDARTDYEPLAHPSNNANGRVWHSPEDFFTLLQNDIKDIPLDIFVDQPAIATSTRGELTFTASNDMRTITPGEALFLPNTTGAVTISGPGQLAFVSLPQAQAFRLN